MIWIKKRVKSVSYNKNIGRIGESIAEKYLINNGYKILERNFKSKTGEIDIIAYKSNILVFVEVKTRTNNKFGFAHEAVDYRKKKKIQNTANSYINFKKIENIQYRFDIIEVYLTTKEINHIIDAFWM